MNKSNSLPIFHTSDQDLSLMQSNWASKLNPMLRNPSLLSRILKQVSLTSGDNTISHGLGRELTGWRIIRKRAAADIYDKQDSNSMPELTLVLNSSTSLTCDIEVF